MVLWRKRQENFKECNAIKHKSRKTLKRVLWLLLLYKIVVFPSCSDIQKNLVYMLYLEWYDAKYIKKSRSFQKQCVFPLFSKKKKKQLRFCRNCLISNVDQPGLEPGASRLWVYLWDISCNCMKHYSVDNQWLMDFVVCRKITIFAPVFMWKGHLKVTKWTRFHL